MPMINIEQSTSEIVEDFIKFLRDQGFDVEPLLDDKNNIVALAIGEQVQWAAVAMHKYANDDEKSFKAFGPYATEEQANRRRQRISQHDFYDEVVRLIR